MAEMEASTQADRRVEQGRSTLGGGARRDSCRFGRRMRESEEGGSRPWMRSGVVSASILGFSFRSG
jgi:hypothetical protein